MISCNCSYCNHNNYSGTSCNFNLYSWDMVPYPNQKCPPQPEEKLCYSWPLVFFDRNDSNMFVNKSGEIIPFDIKEPDMSVDFKSEFEELVNIQQNLTEYQVKLAKYWGYGPPTKQFTPIADILITTYKVTACRASRILHVLQSALNDSSIICWHYKYRFNVLRPSQYDRNFKTVIPIPNHPSYPAGHSTQAGCMAEILSYFFPAEREKLFSLAKDCSDSRLYAGVHYYSDCYEGLNLGVHIAKEVIKEIEKHYNGNNSSVDMIYYEFKDADIIPYTLEQYI